MSETIIYNKIGKGYNTTRKADPYITERLYALLQPIEGQTFLDIGCGTGNYTVALAEKGLNMIGIDPSEVMLNEAKQKSGKVEWLTGSAENIPLKDNSADGIVATLTVHHWRNYPKAFAELTRVMKHNARLVIFTFTPEQEQGYWFNHFFPEMMQRGIKKSLSLIQIGEYAKQAGLTLSLTEKYFVQDDLQDMFGYSGKRDPERYFIPEIVNGISYFSIHAAPQEKEEGFRKLRACIDAGEFNGIQQQYENDLGDYLFVVLKK